MGNTVVVDGIVGSHALGDALKMSLSSYRGLRHGGGELNCGTRCTQRKWEGGPLPGVDIASTPAEGTISVELAGMAKKAAAAKSEVLDPKVRGEPRVETRSARSNRGGHGRLEERHS